MGKFFAILGSITETERERQREREKYFNVVSDLLYLIVVECVQPTM